jgi:hypothetical protein
MKIASYNFKNPKFTFKPTKKPSKPTLSAQNEPNFKNTKKQLNHLPETPYINSPKKTPEKTNPIRTQFEPKTNPIQTQFEPKRSQTNPIWTPLLLSGIKNIANQSKQAYITSLNLESINTNERIIPWIA